MGKERIKVLAGLGWCVGSRELRDTGRSAGEEGGEGGIRECSREEEPQEWGLCKHSEAR